MSTIRFKALQETHHRTAVKIVETEKRSALFGRNVFNQQAMQQYLTRTAFESVVSAIEHGTKIERKRDKKIIS